MVQGKLKSNFQMLQNKFRIFNVFFFWFTEALEGQELLEAMEPEYVDDKDKREGTFDSVFLGNRG